MMDLPHSRVRVTASQSKRRATGSMPVEGSSRKITGGPPMRAMPALSFRLFPPLQRSHRIIKVVNNLRDQVQHSAENRSEEQGQRPTVITGSITKEEGRQFVHTCSHL